MTDNAASILDRTRIVSLPLATRFRGIEHREAALIEGPEGWGEFSPFLEYEPTEAVQWLRAAIADAFEPRPAALRDRIPVNATMPAVPVEQVESVLRRYDGCRTVKVKVAERGQTLADDVSRVREVRTLLPDARIRVDANGAWTVDEAETAVHALAAFDLEYVEQPSATVAELADVRRRIKHMGVRVAADESVRRATDPLEVARAGAADIVIVKAQPLGGIARALAIVAESGLDAVVSSAIDTSVGLSMGAALAAALPELPYDCGLGTASLFVDDIGMRPVDGSIPVQRVTPDWADAFAASADRRDWWMARISACAQLL